MMTTYPSQKQQQPASQYLVLRMPPTTRRVPAVVVARDLGVCHQHYRRNNKSEPATEDDATTMGEMTTRTEVFALQEVASLHQICAIYPLLLFVIMLLLLSQLYLSFLLKGHMP